MKWLTWVGNLGWNWETSSHLDPCETDVTSRVPKSRDFFLVFVLHCRPWDVSNTWFWIFFWENLQMTSSLTLEWRNFHKIFSISLVLTLGSLKAEDDCHWTILQGVYWEAAPEIETLLDVVVDMVDVLLYIVNVMMLELWHTWHFLHHVTWCCRHLSWEVCMCWICIDPIGPLDVRSLFFARSSWFALRHLPSMAVCTVSQCRLSEFLKPATQGYANKDVNRSILHPRNHLVFTVRNLR